MHGMRSRRRGLVRSTDACEAGSVDEAKKILTEADKLPKLPEFESQLTAIRIPAIELAQKKKDRLAEARIKRLTDQAAELIRQYLSEDKLRRVREEVDQLVEAAKTATPEKTKSPGKQNSRVKKSAPRSAEPAPTP